LSRECIDTCIGLQTADILVHIGFVLSHSLRAFQQFVELRLQGFFLLLIVCKQFSASLVRQIAKHSVLIDLADQLAEVINSLFDLTLTLAVLSRFHGNIAPFPCKILCPCFTVIHHKVDLSLNILQDSPLKDSTLDIVRGTIALAVTNVHTATVGIRAFILRCFLHFHLSTAFIAVAQPRQRVCDTLRCASATAHRSIDLLHLIPQFTANDRFVIIFNDNPFGLVLANDLVVFIAYRGFFHLSKVSDIDRIDKQSLDCLSLPQMP